MPKPTVFFSHSSKDKQVISELKELLVKKTSGTMDFFSSSDGQSISFGKNWIHAIEKALDETSIMFVFLTPDSLQANWIYFESGFSYSKNVQVVPVGMFGIDLNQVQPPLSLLQGFNITSFEGLNNIISIINSKFQCSYVESFDKDEFELLEKIGTKVKRRSSSNILNIVNNVYLKLSGEIEKTKDKVEVVRGNLKQTVEYFDTEKIEHRVVNSVFETYGLKISPYFINSSSNVINYDIEIDPFLYKENLKHLKQIIIKLFVSTPNSFYLQVNLKSNFDLMNDTVHISSMLKGHNIRFSRIDRAFEYQNIEFKVDTVPGSQGASHVLTLISSLDNLDNFEIEGLVNLLVDTGVVFEARFVN